MPVTILDSPAEIQKARDLWTAWPGSRDSDLDFFLYIAGARPEVQSPYVLVADHEGVPEALLIGRLERQKVPFKFGYLRFKTPRLRVLNFVYGGFRGKATPEIADLLVEHVLKSLRQGDVDLAFFEDLSLDSSLYRAARDLPGFLERDLRPESQIHRCLELPDSSEDLYKTLSPKNRQNYRRKARKLEKEFSGDVRVHCYRSSSELDQMFRDVEQISGKTYQRSLGFASLQSAEMRGWWELAASKGWLRMYILYIAGKPCAYWNAMAYGGTVWGDHVGFDPAYAQHSPGMYLSLRVLGELCDQKKEHGITRVDFGRGDAEYKSILSNLSFEESPVRIYGRTLRMLASRTLMTPVGTAHRVAREVLAKANLLAKAKRAWRSYALGTMGLSK
jgi:CelD/BcsL family acetyltransferase involved in cellulose biosynthesis